MVAAMRDLFRLKLKADFDLNRHIMKPMFRPRTTELSGIRSEAYALCALGPSATLHSIYNHGLVINHNHQHLHGWQRILSIQ